MDWDVLAEKFEKTKAVLKAIGLIASILAIFNIVGWILKYVEFTIIGSILILIIYFMWAADTRVDRIEKALKNHGITIEEKKRTKMSKKGSAQVIGIITLVIILIILYLIFEVLIF